MRRLQRHLFQKLTEKVRRKQKQLQRDNPFFALNCVSVVLLDEVLLSSSSSLSGNVQAPIQRIFEMATELPRNGSIFF